MTCSSGTKLFFTGSGAQRGQVFGDLEADEQTFPADGVLENHADGIAEIGNEGERVAGIDRQGRENGEDVFHEVLIGGGAIELVQRVVVADEYSFALQGRLQIVQPAGDVRFEHRLQAGVDGIKLLLRRAAIE